MIKAPPLRANIVDQLSQIGQVWSIWFTDLFNAVRNLGVENGSINLVAGTATITTKNITANSRVLLTAQSLNGVATPQAVSVTSRNAGVSFTITSASAADTSLIAWQITEAL